MDIALFATTALVGRFYLAGSSSTTAKSKSSSSSSSPAISWTLLQQQNAATSSALIEHYANSSAFQTLSKYEGDLTMQRDAEDDAKLQVGIDFAKSKGVIDPKFVPEPYVQIDVLGKTPQQVAQIIMNHVKKGGSSNDGDSNVIVLVGLSGTGKGTTVSVLRKMLQQDKQVVTWSNGNIFRSVTLLAATWCEQQFGKHAPFDADKTLTKENLAKFMSMLSFDKNATTGQYDTRIHGLGLDLLVSQVQNTTLKIPAVSKNIPTVAQATQGEVILFAAAAVQRMGQDGIFVLLEGREQTVNYVRTPHRFRLVLSDPTLIGKRRAAQRLMGAALEAVKKTASTTTSPSETQIQQTLDMALENMVKEIH